MGLPVFGTQEPGPQSFDPLFSLFLFIPPILLIRTWSSEFPGQRLDANMEAELNSLYQLLHSVLGIEVQTTEGLSVLRLATVMFHEWILLMI